MIIGVGARGGAIGVGREVVGGVVVRLVVRVVGGIVVSGIGAVGGGGGLGLQIASCISLTGSTCESDDSDVFWGKKR